MRSVLSRPTFKLYSLLIHVRRKSLLFISAEIYVHSNISHGCIGTSTYAPMSARTASAGTGHCRGYHSQNPIDMWPERWLLLLNVYCDWIVINWRFLTDRT